MPWKNLTFGPGRTRCLYMSKLFNLFSAITRFSFYLSTDLLEVGAVLFSWKRQQLLTAKPRRWRWCCTQRNMGPLEQPCPRWVWGIYSAKIVCNFQGLGGKKKKRRGRRCVNSIIFPAREESSLLSQSCPHFFWLSIWSKTDISFNLFLSRETRMEPIFQELHNHCMI